jgi:hypothetical protein
MSAVLTINLPEALRREIDRLAHAHGVSAEDFVVGVVAEKASAIQSAARYFADRAAGAVPGEAKRFFEAEAGDEQPREGDRLS